MIYYDITDLLDYARSHDRLTGIQRVSTQLINRIVNKRGPNAFQLISYHPIWQRIVSFSAAYFAGEKQYRHDEFAEHFELRSPNANLHVYVESRYGSGAIRHYHRGRLLLANALTG